MPKIGVIGDIHGEIHKLRWALDYLINSACVDTIYSLGDVVDRGLFATQCLAMLKEYKVKCLMGNHELMMLQSFDEDYIPIKDAYRHWRGHGGNETLISTNKLSTDEQIQALIPYMLHIAENFEIIKKIQLGDKLYILSHAPLSQYTLDNIVAYEDFKSPLDEILWNRWEATSIPKNVINIHGHTVSPDRHKKVGEGDRYNLDSGAVFGNPLSFMIIQEDLIEVKQTPDYIASTNEELCWMFRGVNE